MLKLLKNMRTREILFAVLCIVLVVAQVYFDLSLPDYMTELTRLMNTEGTQTSEVWTVGLKMLGCALISAVLCVACGFLAARTASGFSFTVREKLFRHVMDADTAEMNGFSVPSLITRTTNDITQIQMIVSMGLQMLVKSPIMAVWAVVKILNKSWELSVVTAGFVGGDGRLLATLPQGAKDDGQNQPRHSRKPQRYQRGACFQRRGLPKQQV